MRALALLEALLALSSMVREGESGKNVLFDSIETLRCIVGAEEDEDSSSLGTEEALEPMLPRKLNKPREALCTPWTKTPSKLAGADAGAWTGGFSCAVDEEESKRAADGNSLVVRRFAGLTCCAIAGKVLMENVPGTAIELGRLGVALE
jgi:hypothetical protein